MSVTFLSLRLSKRLKHYSAVPLLERMLTYYLRDVCAQNDLAASFDYPIAVNFGEGREDINFVCFSDVYFEFYEREESLKTRDFI